MKLILIVAGNFLCGDGDQLSDDYNALVKAQEDGHGSDFANNYATVWEQCDAISVDNILDAIDAGVRILEEELVPAFLNKIDWTDLRGQKSVLIKMADAIRDTPPQPYEKDGVKMAVIMMPKETEDVIEGILGLIDAVQDYAVDKLGVPEMHVYDFEEEEEREKETFNERFARECATRIFDELTESDGFHQDDEMSEEFIASIMADKMHSDIIKAKIKNQIQEDITKSPDEFLYDDTRRPMYDADMREDYEGLVTAYIRELYREKK